jgi:hypothetical protein
MNCYIHIVPGRMRIRSEFLKKNELGAFSLRKGMCSFQGVTSVVTNTTTGSILICFDILQVSSQALLTKLAHHNAIPHFEFRQSVNDPSRILRVSIESRRQEGSVLLPFFLKRTARFILSSLEIPPGAVNVIVNVILQTLVQAI